MKPNSLLVVALSLITLSCTKYDSRLNTMPTDYKQMNFSLDSIAEDMRIIPLKNDIPVLRSRYIDYYDDMLYIGNLNNGMIYRYSLTGDYIDCLDKQGRGPEEYIYIADFFVDDMTGNLYISTNVDKIIVYDKNFEFVRNISYPYERNGTMMTRYLNSEIYIFYFNYNREGYALVKMDTLGLVLQKYATVDITKVPRSEFDLQIFENEGKLYRYNNLNDTIYEIDQDGFYPYCLLGRKFSDGYDLVIDESAGRSPYKSDSPYREIRSIYGIGKYWIINYRKINPEPRYRLEETVLYDCLSNTSYLINSSEEIIGQSINIGIPNDWVGWGTIFPRGTIHIGNKKYILYPIDANKYIEKVLTKEFRYSDPQRPELKRKMINIADTLDNNDNPVLILLKLR